MPIFGVSADVLNAADMKQDLSKFVDFGFSAVVIDSRNAMERGTFGPFFIPHIKSWYPVCVIVKVDRSITDESHSRLTAFGADHVIVVDENESGSVPPIGGQGENNRSKAYHYSSSPEETKKLLYTGVSGFISRSTTKELESIDPASLYMVEWSLSSDQLDSIPSSAVQYMVGLDNQTEMTWSIPPHSFDIQVVESDYEAVDARLPSNFPNPEY